MWLSWKSLGQLAALYTLIAWAKHKTATGGIQKMILEDRKVYRSYDVIYITRIIARKENMHGKLNKRLAHDEKSAPGATEGYSERFQSEKGMGG